MRPASETGTSGFAATILLAALTVMLLLPATPHNVGTDGREDTTGMEIHTTGTREAPEILLLPDNLHGNVTVEPGETGKVVFEGIMRVNSSGMYSEDEYFRIILEVEIDLGWSTIISPSSIAAQAGDNVSFTVSCRAPPAVSSSITGRISLGGTCTPYSSPTSHPVIPVQLYVHVDPYYRFSIESGIAYQDWDGDAVEYLVKVNNEGNADDIYHIDIMNEDYLKDKGLDIELSTTAVIVAEKESESFTMWVDISTSTPSQEYPIHLRFTSLGETDAASVQYRDFYLYLSVDEFAPGWFGRSMSGHVAECMLIIVLLAVFITALALTVRKRRRLMREWVMKMTERDDDAGSDRDTHRRGRGPPAGRTKGRPPPVRRR